MNKPVELFYIYYNYVINQADPLLAGVTDEREEVNDEGTTEVEETVEETEGVTQ